MNTETLVAKDAIREKVYGYCRVLDRNTRFWDQQDLGNPDFDELFTVETEREDEPVLMLSLIELVEPFTAYTRKMKKLSIEFGGPHEHRDYSLVWINAYCSGMPADPNWPIDAPLPSGSRRGRCSGSARR